MSKILSQEEIDALLSSLPAGKGSRLAADGGGTTSATTAVTNAVTYNFRRPDRVSKEQIRSLHFLHDRFARDFSTSLAAYLRTMTEVSIVSVEQFSYSEFLMSLPDPTAYYALGLSPLDGIGALELNPALAFAMVSRMLGGSTDGVAPNRALTEIEQNVVDSVVKLVLEHLTETWRSVYDLHFRIQGRETRPQMLQVAGPNEPIILLVFDVKIGGIRGMLNVCIPASVIEVAGSAFTHEWHRKGRETTAQERHWLEANLGRMPFGVAATIEARMSARDLLDLNEGDVVSLDVSVRTPVSVRIENLVKFKGRLSASDGRRAVLIERSAMGDADAEQRN
jgi:flagellar motor switch protein FliM